MRDSGALPVPAAHALAGDAVIAVRVPEPGLVLFRLLRAADAHTDDFRPGFTPNQARARGIAELARCGVSHWREPHQALGAHRGDGVAHVARIVLDADHALVRVALTEAGRDGELRPGHIDVWAHPETLSGAVSVVTHHQL